MKPAIAPWPLQLRITELQRRFGRCTVSPRTREDYLRIARWWLLEAKRWHPSSERSQRFIESMRARAEAAT